MPDRFGYTAQMTKEAGQRRRFGADFLWVLLAAKRTPASGAPGA
jgi:hypothetical protein